MTATLPDRLLLETERLWLCGWAPEQVPDLQRLHGNADTAKYLTADGHGWSADECARAVATYISDFDRYRMGKLRLVDKADGRFVGRAGFGVTPPYDEPELGYALLPENRGKGYAREAATALRDWIFRETRWEYFVGFADVRNTSSLAILRDIGMEKTHVAVSHGIVGQYHILRQPGR